MHLLIVANIICLNLRLFAIKLDKFDFSLMKFNNIETCCPEMIFMLLHLKLILKNHEVLTGI